MKLYIRSGAAISPQKTSGTEMFPEELVSVTGPRLNAAEPDYKDIIDPKLIRRMSHIIKMGVATANECLRRGDTAMPDAIITGTAYGCLEDTAQFLTKLVEHKEEMLSPTSFIQSTHNTVGAQIALLLHCHQYNNTFVHRGFSFESALYDAMMYADENPQAKILTGGVDEITDTSYHLLSRLGLLRTKPVNNLELLHNPERGTIAGEGAAFFLVSGQPGPTDTVVLEGVSTFYKPANLTETETHIRNFLDTHRLHAKDIDLVITGRNGDVAGDAVYDHVVGSIFPAGFSVPFKHLCGEYPTAASFALWMPDRIIKSGTVPEIPFATQRHSRPIKTVLIYNHYLQMHHSMYLVRAC